MARTVLVTGANSGIGFALCKQLVGKKFGCRVLLGARSADKGKAAVAEILKESPEAKLEYVSIDVADNQSVATAAQGVKQLLGGEPLFAIVNNAGTGLAHKGVDAACIINTNLYGPKRVVDAFLPLLNGAGRIVNVGSGAGPKYTSNAAPASVALLTSWDTSFAQLSQHVEDELKGLPKDQSGLYAAYGLSKAALTTYGMDLARQFAGTKGVTTKVNCVSPGFIATAIVAGFGATKSPEEGTVSILHCLFEDVGNGFYYGSDGVRSHLVGVRNPGEPEYKPTDDKYQ